MINSPAETLQAESPEIPFPTVYERPLFMEKNYKLMNEECNSFVNSRGLTNFLAGKGYRLINRLGEGKTRTAFLAEYVSGEKKHLRVVKIPLEDFDKSSICTLINKSKEGDMDQNEAQISNFLSHPNIVDILENLKFNGININVESYFQQAQSLEEVIGKTGAITNDKNFMNIFSQVIAGVEYANFMRAKNSFWCSDNEGILLRDIKPSNILVGKDGLVKLTDFQNAKKIEDITELSLPTRGGTAYTRPELLNALLGGKPAKATRRSEVYAVAASMYYALTGGDVFPYNMVELDTTDPLNFEKNILIGGKAHSVKLFMNNKPVNGINPKLHERFLKIALKKVPNKYRKMLYKGLTMDESHAYSDVKSMKYDLEKLKAPSRSDWLQKAYSLAKPVAITFAATAALSWVVWYGATSAPQRSAPTMSDMLRSNEYINFSMSSWDNPRDSLFVMDILAPYYKDAKKKLPLFILGKDGKWTAERNDVDWLVSTGGVMRGIDKRLIAGLMYSCFLVGNDKETVDEIYPKIEGQRQRVSRTYVPINFIFKTDRYNTDPKPEDMGLIQKGAMACSYLKMCINQDNVAEIYAQYFCSNEEISIAKMKTHSTTFYPSFKKDGTVNIGYSLALPERKKDLVNMAVAMYRLSDEDGGLRLNRFPDLRTFYGQYSGTLKLPGE